MVITGVIALLAIIGPWLAPYGENDIVGKPFTLEGSCLGTDYLGQDVWSRVLAGGGSILMISVLATALGMVVGIIIGVVAAYAGGWLDEAIMRLNDVALAFPQILLALLVLTAVDQPDVVDDRAAGRRSRTPRAWRGSPEAWRWASSPATSSSPPKRSARAACG